MASSNLTVRFVTAIICLPLLLWLLFAGPAWGWALLVGTAACVAAVEFNGFTHPAHEAPERLFAVVLTAAMFGAVWFWNTSPLVALLVVAACPIGALLFTLFRFAPIETAALRALGLAVSPLYVGVPMGLIAALRRDGGADGPILVVLALGFAWLSDTGGYFAGRFFGKRPLYLAISPKKTWEGALGGAALAAIGAVLAHFALLPSLPLASAIVLAVVASGLGQLGDLCESMLKRSANVKDSGGILPGHGGILDRIDALLWTGTLTYAYVALIGLGPS